MYLFIFLKIFYLFISRQRGREREREGEKHHCVVASLLLPTGDLTCNPGMCPDWEFNPQPFGYQPSAQSTEPHQPGPYRFLIINFLHLSILVVRFSKYMLLSKISINFHSKYFIELCNVQR